MEVHHPHNPTHKKKWSEYIVEFVMLFAAVTLGFFAENAREHISEQNKKKELLEVVSQDFIKDLEQLEYHENFTKEKLELSDKMIKYFDGNHDSINQRVYYHAIHTIKGWWFFNSEEKSRIEAEAKGYFTEEHEAVLIDKFNNQMPYITDVNVFLPRNRYPEPVMENTFGIKNINKSELLKTKYIISEIIFNNDIYINDIDSMKLYANKAIEIIKNQHK